MSTHEATFQTAKQAWSKRRIRRTDGASAVAPLRTAPAPRAPRRYTIQLFFSDGAAASLCDMSDAVLARHATSYRKRTESPQPSASVGEHPPTLQPPSPSRTAELLYMLACPAHAHAVPILHNLPGESHCALQARQCAPIQSHTCRSLLCPILICPVPCECRRSPRRRSLRVRWSRSQGQQFHRHFAPLRSHDDGLVAYSASHAREGSSTPSHAAHRHALPPTTTRRPVYIAKRAMRTNRGMEGARS